MNRPRYVLLGKAARDLLDSLTETATGKWVFLASNRNGPLTKNELY